MRWRTPRCGALAEGHANERMEARSGTWIRAVCRGGGTGARLSSEACPPDRVSFSRPGSPSVSYETGSRSVSLHLAGDPRLFSAGQGTVENFLRELVAGKARR